MLVVDAGPILLFSSSNNKIAIYDITRGAVLPHALPVTRILMRFSHNRI